MIRDSVLKVPIDNKIANKLDDIISDLTLPNPEYESTLRFSKWVGAVDNIPKELEFFYIEKNTLILPRNYFETSYVDKTVKGEFADIKFLKDLRDYQDDYVGEIDYKNIYDFVLQMPCGTGKTSLGIYLASVFKVKTLVLVPTNYLLKQWVDRIRFFTGEEPLVIDSRLMYNDSYTIKKHKIYLVTYDMFNSIINISNKSNEALAELLNVSIGYCIVDELHKTGANTYHPIISQIPAKRRVGLTATLRRKDGREKIISYHFGQSFILPNPFPPAHFYVINTGIKVLDVYPLKKLQPDIADILDKHEIPYKLSKNYLSTIITDEDIKVLRADFKFKTRSLAALKKEVSFTHIDSFISEDYRCLKQYQTIIRTCLNNGRTVLVLSKRKEVLRTLFKVFKNDFPTSLVISETNKQSEAEEHKLQHESKLVLGIMQLAEFGLDIDRIDTLVLLHPISDTEQAIGRVIRYVKNKKQPLVFLPLNKCNAHFGIYKKSLKFVDINAEVKSNITVKELKNVLNEENYSPYK